ncbi:poly [ADP-ribose] polymerase 11-like [Pomacea canaliculata]|uniref:poly [ADP-ribose] polymerase 11-like n=1 Tax=Pomacea canaliculata TaxID=400727 RepID=UPI000D728645|nr:poly [ADP-ribose] polymerase 11-like [Pomacea canaliculata]
MVQTNLDTQRTTSVIRRPVFITADTSGAPRMSSLLLSEVPTSVLHQVPDHWSAVDHFQDFELVELSETAAEYITVQRQFFSTMNRRMHKTVHIFRVQNPGLWDKYCSARRAMTPRGQRPGEVEERRLFHGTPTLDAARGICANGFDFRRSGENVGTVWGKGAYFSTTARYSHSYTRIDTTVTGDPLRFMFLGKVLVGQYTLGDPSYTKPPERDRLKLYDSCVNDYFNPTIFVIFDLAQSYPEYLIQYTSFSAKPEKMVRTQSQPRSQASGTSLSRRITE